MAAQVNVSTNSSSVDAVLHQECCRCMPCSFRERCNESPPIVPHRQETARYLDTHRAAPFWHQPMHSNAVHQSTSSWWMVRKFLDGMRTVSSHSPTLAKPRQNSLYEIGEISRPYGIGASHYRGTFYLSGSETLPHNIAAWLLDEAAVYR